MIKRIRHRGLARFHATGETKGINAANAAWLRILLTALDAASSPAGLNFPGFGLHPLKGDRKGQWSVWVTKNLRLVFRFEGEDVTDIDMLDYH